MLANAHSFKDKSDRLASVNSGLFTYPVLMAADILLYDADIVPVGKDQVQHLEITRDIAGAFNHVYKDSFVIPSTQIDEKVMIVPGIDGQKMSKSYSNVIDIFLPAKKLRKQIMSIKTDSLDVESPKRPADCTIFKIYSLIADDLQVKILEKKYLSGGFGYGHAKQELFDVICNKFKKERDSFEHLMNNTNLIENELMMGAEKASEIANNVLTRVRSNIGYA
tara:strand:- start:1076 stop:1741 length:666 start_codon:yes stop_codon:yes gene_type:complete